MNSELFRNQIENPQSKLQNLVSKNYNFVNSNQNNNQFDTISPYEQFKAFQASKANPFQLKSNLDSGQKKIDFF